METGAQAGVLRLGQDCRRPAPRHQRETGATLRPDLSAAPVSDSLEYGSATSGCALSHLYVGTTIADDDRLSRACRQHMLLIGLDAASKWTNFGYAIGQCESGIIDVEEAGLVQSPTESDALANRIAPRLRDLEHALVAVDAPLGWPRALALALKEHCAGEPIEVGKDGL